ncbi:cupin domain-containing protein [Crossiella sp. SN42]|uniref:cupin domain-containing protein n=1 Tax=Crossiella sp. SN42 TaxID=2944808 RepID=UPI00207CD9F9|nr:cupin domain-containing protein [Crossiella sp. SN42]MCO1579837.1 cupin domain-containing protein [Crossiella sp. SN42]
MLTAERTTLPPATACPPRRSRASVLLYVRFGALDVRLGDRMAYLANGDQLAIPAGVEHSWRTPVDSSADIVVVTAELPLTSTTLEV